MIKVKFFQYPTTEQNSITFNNFEVSEFNLEECVRGFLQARAVDVPVTDNEVEEFLDEINTNTPYVLRMNPHVITTFYDNTTIIFTNMDIEW